MHDHEFNSGNERGSQRLLRTLSRPDVRWWLALVAFVTIALLARAYGLVLQGWTPDTYEQILAARRLADGDFPLSKIYPPGVAVTLAPFFLFLPSTLETVQAVTIGASLLLIVVVAVGVRRTTGDETAALVAGCGVALAPWLLYYSRDGLFDIINTLWIISAILIVPAVHRRGWVLGLAFGAMVAVACTVRATNVILVPALLLYWITLGGDWSVGGIRRSLMMHPALTAIPAFLAVYAALVYLSGWLATATSAPVTPADLPLNLAFYYAAEFGLHTVVVLLPLALLGGKEVWRRNPGFALVCAYMIVVWPLPHAPLSYVNVRYILPAYVCALILVAHSPTVIWAMWTHSGGARRAAAGAACLGLGAIALMFVTIDVWMVTTWDHRVKRSDETAYRQLRPFLEDIPSDSVVVGTGVLGVQDTNPGVEYINLIDISLEDGGNEPPTVARVVDDLRAAMRDGRSVYYLYTRFEEPGVNQEGDNLGRPGPGFREYYEALDLEHDMKLVVDTSVPYFELYQVLPDGSSAAGQRQKMVAPGPSNTTR